MVNKLKKMLKPVYNIAQRVIYQATTRVCLLHPKKAVVCFVCDDGHKTDWTILKPIFELKNIPATVAIVAGEDALQSRMLQEQVLYLQNALGWEVASHAYTHANLRALNESQLVYELLGSKTYLLSCGYNVKNFVAPYGSNDNEVVCEEIARYYNCGVSIGGMAKGANVQINVPPIKKYRLARVAMGSYFDYPNNGFSKTSSLKYYKSKVDRVRAVSGLLLFMLHSNHRDFDATQQQHLSDLIDYIQAKGLPIVTLQQAIEAIG
jgi:peptidoglycan/xylan/chitin deacetylase (PgdA/CDA1 family)